MNKNINFYDNIITFEFHNQNDEKFSFNVRPLYLIDKFNNKTKSLQELLWYYPPNKESNLILGKKLYLEQLLYDKNEIVATDDDKRKLSKSNYLIDTDNFFFPINFFPIEYNLINSNNKKFKIYLFLDNEINQNKKIIIYIPNYDSLFYFKYNLDIFSKKDIKVIVKIPEKNNIKDYKINLTESQIKIIEKITNEYFSFENYEFNKITNNKNINEIKNKLLKTLNNLQNIDNYYFSIPLTTFIFSNDCLLIKSSKIIDNFFEKENNYCSDNLLENFNLFSNFIEYNLLFSEKYFEDYLLASITYYKNFLNKFRRIEENICSMILNKSIMRISEMSLDLRLLKEIDDQNTDCKELSLLFFKYFLIIYFNENNNYYSKNINEIKNYFINFFTTNFNNKRIRRFLIKGR